MLIKLPSGFPRTTKETGMSDFLAGLEGFNATHETDMKRLSKEYFNILGYTLVCFSCQESNEKIDTTF